jgi:hypothetical protein
VCSDCYKRSVNTPEKLSYTQLESAHAAGVQNLREENRQLRHIIDEEAKDSGRVILELSAAQSLLAMQREALKAAFDEVSDEEISVMIQEAHSATAETVADWKAKELSEASVSSSPFGYFRVSQKTGRWEEMTDTEREYSEESGLPLFTAEELTKREAAAKQAGRDEVMKELSEMEPVWYMYRDGFGYWRNFNEAEAGQMVKRGDSWAAFDKMIRRPTYKKG